MLPRLGSQERKDQHQEATDYVLHYIHCLKTQCSALPFQFDIAAIKLNRIALKPSMLLHDTYQGSLRCQSIQNIWVQERRPRCAGGDKNHFSSQIQIQAGEKKRSLCCWDSSAVLQAGFKQFQFAGSLASFNGFSNDLLSAFHYLSFREESHFCIISRLEGL